MALIVAALAACSDSDHPAVLLQPDSPEFTMLYGCVNFSPIHCEMLQDAIWRLRLHADATCRQIGDNAFHRFDSDNLQYQDLGDDFGWSAPPYPVVLLSDRAFEPGELMNTIAHEESHFAPWSAPDYGEYSAYYYGTLCASDDL